MSWDLDRAEAVELVQEYLHAMEPPSDAGDEWQISQVVDHPWGWAISWCNKLAIEWYTTGDHDVVPGFLYGGGGPFLVDRVTGRVAMAGSAQPVDYYIQQWLAGDLPDYPRP